MGFHALPILLACLAAGVEQPASQPETAPEETRETVVLVHGLGRTRVSLWVMEWRLRQAGYVTLNFPYDTSRASLDELSGALQKFISEKVKTPKYHLVAHSLGNIIIRNGFKQPYREGLGRVVMLAPPNQPADLARLLKENPVFQWISGDSGQKLSDGDSYRDLPVPSVEFGIIAGDKGQQVTFESPNDGIVTVESTKLAGMKDWLVVHHTHTFMMNSSDVGEFCVHFLKNGAFKKESNTQAQ